MSLAVARAKRQERFKISQEMNALVPKSGGEKMTPEAIAKFDALDAQAQSLGKEIDAIERADTIEREMSARVERRAIDLGVSGDQVRAEDREHADAFRSYLKKGIVNISDDHREIMRTSVNAHLPSEVRNALSTVSGPEGGYLVPEVFSNQIIEAERSWGGMMEAAHVFDTDTGNRMPFPTSDDTNNIGALLQENTPVLEKDVSFGSIALEAYTYTSRLVLLPLQLIQDSAFPIDVYLAGVLGIRLGRAINADLTTGDGASKPNGLVTAASVGTTCAAGQTTSISSDDLFELKHSVDPAYRRGAKWMFHDSTLKAVKKLKDGVGRPLWTAGLDLKAPDTIDGDAYVINQDMPEMSANAKSIAYGDFSKYFVRRVKGVTLIRLDERYAERLQVGFLAFQRVDGELMDAGTHPVTVLQNSAE